MKTIHILLLSFIFSGAFAQEINEKVVKSTVNEVTVFLKGAQITRKKDVELPQGKSLVKFTNLSPFIDTKTVQAKTRGELTILSVSHQNNHLEKSEKSKELIDLEHKLAETEEQINLENTQIFILREELEFLQLNRDIGGKNQATNVSNLQQAYDFYEKKLTDLKMREIENRKVLTKLHKQKKSLNKQINSLSNKKDFPSGEVLVKVDAKFAGNFPIELSYVVDNAGWFPGYDVRAENINEPIQLVYKANVKQNTKVDWVNAKLQFSSANPNVSGVAPKLKTHFLNYHTLPPSYQSSAIHTVRGKIVESSGEALPGANVVVSGTTIGTVTDMDGNYSITIPQNAKQLNFSFIGFTPQNLPITSETMNVMMHEDDELALEEVVVTASEYNKSARSAKIKKESLTGAALPIPMEKKENQTTVNFEIKTPYTVRSNNKNHVVDMMHHQLPAFYQYYCVPKIDKDAFLIANIMDWEQYNLLEGEANVFFEGTYIGKSLLDVRYASDTLEISLGRDKNVSVNRKKMENFTTKQFMGNKKEESRAFKTSVKNNKKQSINMIVLDQIPVSTTQEIEVNVQKTSGAKLNKESGEIKWEFRLEPSREKELDLKYSVKYPKNKQLVIE